MYAPHVSNAPSVSEQVTPFFQAAQCTRPIYLVNQLFKTFFLLNDQQSLNNKLAKARKMRKPTGTLSLKFFGPGKLWVKKVLAQNIFIELIHSKKISFHSSVFSFLLSKNGAKKKPDVLSLLFDLFASKDAVYNIVIL